MHRLQRFLWILALLAVLGLSIWTRAEAVRHLPLDYDELTYIPLAYRYGEMMAAGHWGEILSFRENLEHPPLVKLLYAVELRMSGAPEPDWQSLAAGRYVLGAGRPAVLGPRTISAAGGVLQVLGVSLANPLGGLLLAFDTYHINYTAEAYLEGVSGLFAVLGVLLFEWAVRKDSSGDRPVRLPPLLFSAAALGLAAAGKYPYALAGLTILPFLLVYFRRKWHVVLLYLALAGVVFLLADPFLWPNPPGRLWEALSFHWRYAHSGQVVDLALPWWQQFYYLTHSDPPLWHRGVFPTRLADELLLALAVVGLPWALRRRPVWVAWAAVGLIFLLLWPTKWPQYTLLVRPALAVVAGVGVMEVGRLWWKGFQGQVPSRNRSPASDLRLPRFTLLALCVTISPSFHGSRFTTHRSPRER